MISTPTPAHGSVVPPSPRDTAPQDVRRGAVLAVAYLLLAIAIALLWAYLTPGSRELTTDFGTVPVNAQDEGRIAGEMWLTVAMAGLGAIAGLLWWWRGPRRGPIALAALGGAVLVGSGIAAWTGGVIAGTRGSTPSGAGVPYDLPAPVDTIAAAIVPTLAAVLCYSIAALLCRDATLRPFVAARPAAHRPRHRHPGSR